MPSRHTRLDGERSDPDAMDRQLIKDLIDALERSGLSELEYTRDGEVLRLVKGAPGSARPSAHPAPAAPAAPLPVAGQADDATVSAPLYGVVHLRPAPDAKPFVTVDQAVAAGQVLCTIEAMKVFTEVRAPRAGTVEAVLVESGQEVEPGQALMRVA